MNIMDVYVSAQSRKLIKVTKQNNSGAAAPTTLADRQLNNDAANEWVQLPSEEGGKQKLTEKQIIEAAEMCVKIENHYGFPCDIEWAMEGGKLYITQRRPITTLKK